MRRALSPGLHNMAVTDELHSAPHPASARVRQALAPVLAYCHSRTAAILGVCGIRNVYSQLGAKAPADNRRLGTVLLYTDEPRLDGAPMNNLHDYRVSFLDASGDAITHMSLMAETLATANDRAGKIADEMDAANSIISVLDRTGSAVARLRNQPSQRKPKFYWRGAFRNCPRSLESSSPRV
jgi:hypothetical protein